MTEQERVLKVLEGMRDSNERAFADFRSALAAQLKQLDAIRVVLTGDRAQHYELKQQHYELKQQVDELERKAG